MGNKRFIIFLITAILLFHCFNNYYILTNSRYCLKPDELNYFDHIIKIYQTLGKTKLNLKSLYEAYEVIFGYEFKPPLFFLTASPFLLFGIDKNNIIMSNLIYFAILLFATYGIGKKLYNYKVGILSAFLVSMFPSVFALSRVLMLDLSLAAMVALTFYLFVLNKFSSFKFSLFTGIIIGLGTLTRQAYFVYLLPILSYFFFHKENLKNKKIIRNFIFSVIIASMIVAVYYTRFSFDDLLYYHHIFQCKTNPSSYFYLQSILNRQLLLVFSFLFLTGSIFSFRKKKYFSPIMVFVLLIFFSMSPNKQDRFILPIFPYIAVIISGFILSLSKIKEVSIVILVLFVFLQYFLISYGSILPISCNPLQKFLLGLERESIRENGLFSIIDEEYYASSCEEIIKIINDSFEINAVDRKIKALLITQNWKINTTIDYLRIIKKIPIELRKAEIDLTFSTPKKKIDKNFDNQIIQSDFIIMEKTSPDDFNFHAEQLHKSFKRNLDKFQLVKTILFTNISSIKKDKSCLVYIFKNKCLKN